MISHAAVANPRLGIDVVVAETHVRVRVCGELDHATAPLLDAALDVIVDRGCLHLVLDFGELEFFSSAGWQLVADVARRLGLLDGSIEVVSAPEGATRVFEICDPTGTIAVTAD